MKKLLALSMAALVMAPTLVLAKEGGAHPMAGCGVGYVLFGHTKNNKGTQIGSALVSWLIGPVTSSMTSGTSGCTDDGAVKFVYAAELFAEVNLPSLKQEMAMGQGEFVSTFATLLGAKERQVPAILVYFQQEYKTLFPQADVTSTQLMGTLSRELAKHPELLG